MPQKNFSKLLAFVLLSHVILICCPAFSKDEKRVALVIGNSSYKNSPLVNPTNDAHDIASSLRGFGFDVVEKSNLKTKDIGSTLREFKSKLTPGSVAFFFYAGHGVQINGENYLLTVDADIQGEEDVPYQSMSTKQVLSILEDSKTSLNFIFLDACRNNPFTRSFRSVNQGLAKENAPSGTLISYATRPGGVAADGAGRNGLYTSVLLREFRKSDIPIEQVLKGVVKGVKTESKGLQEPWMEGSIEGDFCLHECANNTNSTGLNSTPVSVQNDLSRLFSQFSRTDNLNSIARTYNSGCDKPNQVTYNNGEGAWRMNCEIYDKGKILVEDNIAFMTKISIDMIDGGPRGSVGRVSIFSDYPSNIGIPSELRDSFELLACDYDTYAGNGEYYLKYVTTEKTGKIDSPQDLYVIFSISCGSGGCWPTLQISRNKFEFPDKVPIFGKLGKFIKKKYLKAGEKLIDDIGVLHECRL